MEGRSGAGKVTTASRGRGRWKAYYERNDSREVLCRGRAVWKSQRTGREQDENKRREQGRGLVGK